MGSLSERIASTVPLMYWFPWGENYGIKGNPIGCYDRCTFGVGKGKGTVLRIGDSVGISQAALAQSLIL